MKQRTLSCIGCFPCEARLRLDASAISSVRTWGWRRWSISRDRIRTVGAYRSGILIRVRSSDEGRQRKGTIRRVVLLREVGGDIDETLGCCCLTSLGSCRARAGDESHRYGRYVAKAEQDRWLNQRHPMDTTSIRRQGVVTVLRMKP